MPFLIPLLAGGLSIKVIEDWFNPEPTPPLNYSGVTQGGIIANAKTIAAGVGIIALTYAVMKWKK